VQQVQNIATLVNNSYTVASAVGRLTATDLALPVDQYDDLKYYKAVEYAGFGTGEEADRKAGVLPNGTLVNSTVIKPVAKSAAGPQAFATPVSSNVNLAGAAGARA
jgi:outer membrane protein